MALAKPDATTLLTGATAAISSIVAISGVTAFDTTSVIQLTCEVLCTYNSAATVGGQLEIYGSIDNSNYTTSPIAVYDLPFVANTTIRAEFSVLSSPKYIKPTVRNLDSVSGHTITAITIRVQPQTA
jgi:hypothetical protein